MYSTGARGINTTGGGAGETSIIHTEHVFTHHHYEGLTCLSCAVYTFCTPKPY